MRRVAEVVGSIVAMIAVGLLGWSMSHVPAGSPSPSPTPLVCSEWVGFREDVEEVTLRALVGISLEEYQSRIGDLVVTVRGLRGDCIDRIAYSAAVQLTWVLDHWEPGAFAPWDSTDRQLRWGEIGRALGILPVYPFGYPDPSLIPW